MKVDTYYGVNQGKMVKYCRRMLEVDNVYVLGR